MSLGGQDARRTEDIPGAFPSEDAITESELNSNSNNNSNSNITTTSSGTTPAATQGHTKAYPEHDLGTHQSLAQVGGANNSGIPTQTQTQTQIQNIAHTGTGQGSTSNPADSDPDHLLRRAGVEGVPASGTQGLSAHDDGSSALGGAAGRGGGSSSLASALNPLGGPSVAADDSGGRDGSGPDNAPGITEDLKAMGSGAATAAAAFGIAARDAAVAVRDAAAPMVSAASGQAMQAAGYAAENAGPAASAASEQAKNAAIYTKDSAAPAANAAANAVQANAPAVLGGGTKSTNTSTARDIAPEVPGQVKSSIAEAGEAPEAAVSRQAVQDKRRVEGELLGFAAEVDADEARLQKQQQKQQQQQPTQIAHQQQRQQPPSVLPRLDSGPQTPSTGVAIVLGTDTERSFPLGSHPVHGDGGDQTHPSPSVTDGVQTGGVPQTSSGAGAASTSGSGSGLGSGPTSMSTGDEKPEARRAPPVEDKLPVRSGAEEAVGNGPGTYNKLGSGTPSGVGQ